MGEAHSKRGRGVETVTAAAITLRPKPSRASALRKPQTSARPRLTVFQLENGEEYLYHLNQEQTFRWLIEPGSLTLDKDWIVSFDPTGLGVGNNDEPTSPVIVGDTIY